MRLCSRFGTKPPATQCPHALFVQPFGGDHVAVVQASDHSGPLRFHVLVVPRGTYYDAEYDPFHIAAQYAIPWEKTGEIPALEWTAGPPPTRTVDALRLVLDTPQSATLLGGVQALLDGVCVLFERSTPDEKAVRDLWALLPRASRAELWPATYTCANAEAFHIAVVPTGTTVNDPRFISEEKLGDYPEGRYEFSLQAAVESGDAKELDRLLHRRTRAQVVKLLLGLVAVLLALFLIPIAYYFPGTPPPTGTPPATPPATEGKGP